MLCDSCQGACVQHAHVPLLAPSFTLKWPASNGWDSVAAFYAAWMLQLFLLFGNHAVLVRDGQTVPSDAFAGLCSKTGPGVKLKAQHDILFQSFNIPFYSCKILE